MGTSVSPWLLDSLARVDDLRIPASVTRGGGGVGAAGRRAYLAELLHRDPAVFLERHGQGPTLAHFSTQLEPCLTQ
jgi:hypothetical protein